MKKITLLVVALVFTQTTFSQLKEKIKGSKIVTIVQKEVESFDALEVQDGLEISLIKGEKSGVELEADDNLQDAIALKMNGNMLIIMATKDITSFKKFNIRVTYTDSFKSVVAKNESKINALQEIKLDEINFRALDQAKLYLNIGAKVFNLFVGDKSRVEVNAKSESVNIELSKSAELKALISATEMKCDLYQKATATVEGDVVDLKLRTDNNTNFNGAKLTSKNTILIAEAYSNCTILTEDNISITASGNSEIKLSGNPKIEMKQFSDSAILYKKPVK
jgi:hypothetical protein